METYFGKSWQLSDIEKEKLKGATIMKSQMPEKDSSDYTPVLLIAVPLTLNPN
jgi:hypothetical protein